ncbi:MAG: hypothetical protein ETSY1_31270 [Candidatus Entotheonella factor]|uniref:Uncharacterized protein n=1 Tax=Entotheonella factor TaxID=1429438 RepID=W4LB60_ENTF1|nr:MAG: hypothetical protein ETSY1_31270 [Candidatus Entotheonella factor]
MSESNKVAEYLTPEKLAEHANIRSEVKAHLPELRAEARAAIEEARQTGMPRKAAVAQLRGERKRQGLSDEEMMARSGLDAAALASMSGHDACPTIKTMEAYARALGRKLLIVSADEEPRA